MGLRQSLESFFFFFLIYKVEPKNHKGKKDFEVPHFYNIHVVVFLHSGIYIKIIRFSAIREREREQQQQHKGKGDKRKGFGRKALLQQPKHNSADANDLLTYSILTKAYKTKDTIEQRWFFHTDYLLLLQQEWIRKRGWLVKEL